MLLVNSQKKERIVFFPQQEQEQLSWQQMRLSLSLSMGSGRKFCIQLGAFPETFFPEQFDKRWPISSQSHLAGFLPVTITDSLCLSRFNQLGMELKVLLSIMMSDLHFPCILLYDTHYISKLQYVYCYIFVYEIARNRIYCHYGPVTLDIQFERYDL